MDELQSSLGYRYYLDTVFRRQETFGYRRPDIAPAPFFKTYPQAEKIVLPKPVPAAGADLWQVLLQRRSCRRYSGSSIGMEDLALLLWACQGSTARSGSYLLRTAPSAGALYPLETYVAVRRTEELEEGLYHFDVAGFQLEKLRCEAVGEELAEAALGQRFIAAAAVTFVWTAVFRRNMCKYGHRGMRYIAMDAGHACQNLLLAAEALGRGACPVAAFFDEEINRVLAVDGEEESALYLCAVG